MCMFKTYKTGVNGMGNPLKSVTRRVNKLDRPFDLGKHEDRKIVGYNYLEWISIGGKEK